MSLPKHWKKKSTKREKPNAGNLSVSDKPRKVVFDCNIFAQALLNPLGPAGACVDAAIDGRVRLFISDFVLEEIRDIPNKPTPREVGVTEQKAESLIAASAA